MRARTGMDDRVVADLDQVRVVPAPAELVARVVMGRTGEPDRSRAVRGFLEEDERLLQVRLVIVRARERGAPVVHEVEVHVVQDDPAVGSKDPPVVDVPRVCLADLLVLEMGGRGRAAGYGATEQERGVERRVDEPGEDADAREPAWRVEFRSIRPPIPASEVEAGELLLGEPHREGLAGRGGERHEPLLGQLAIRDEEPSLTLGPTDEQVALRDVRRDGRREEELALGVSDDRLVGLQQLEVGRSRRRDAGRGALGRHRSSSSTASTTLSGSTGASRKIDFTACWLR